MRERSTLSRVKSPRSPRLSRGLGEVDRPRIDSVQAFDEFVPVPCGVLAGDVEERPRDRQRGAQFVGGIRGEPLLLGDVGLELFEH
jgi:hypothetical protein